MVLKRESSIESTQPSSNSLKRRREDYNEVEAGGVSDPDEDFFGFPADSFIYREDPPSVLVNEDCHQQIEKVSFKDDFRRSKRRKRNYSSSKSHEVDIQESPLEAVSIRRSKRNIKKKRYRDYIYRF